MKFIGPFFVVVQRADGSYVTFNDAENAEQAEGIAVRGVNHKEEYRVAHIYSRMKSCRPKGEPVDWAETAPAALPAPAPELKDIGTGSAG